MLHQHGTDGLRQFGQSISFGTQHFVHDHQSLAVIGVDRERDSAINPKRLMRVLDRRLEIVREIVATGDDDLLFQPSRNEQLVLIDEAQVARSEKTSQGSVSRIDLERRLGELLLPPVVVRDRWAPHPDFTDTTVLQGRSRDGIDDSQIAVTHRPAAADQGDRLPRRTRFIGNGEFIGNGDVDRLAAIRDRLPSLKRA